MVFTSDTIMSTLGRAMASSAVGTAARNMHASRGLVPRWSRPRGLHSPLRVYKLVPTVSTAVRYLRYRSDLTTIALSI